ncbi:ATP-binding protein [Magnetovibrio sp. PR-2]|uniref:ATP-binding protein n=1 Tax=Magnetovibrio sp. PR-2 TaxID=3120356 RepID=UPI002FCDF9B8
MSERVPFSTKTVVSVGFLSVLGLLGNMVSIPMFFGVDQIFGSIFVLISAVLYGPLGALVSGAIAHAYTIVLWNHPYAFIAFVAEAVFVGYLCYHRKSNLFVATLLFWVFLGMPMAWVFYHHVLGLADTQSLIVALKQPANGLFNSFVASLLLLAFPLRRWFRGDNTVELISFRDVLLTVIMAFVFFSSFVTAQFNARKILEESQAQVFAELQGYGQHLRDLLSASLRLQRIGIDGPFWYYPHQILEEEACHQHKLLSGNEQDGIVQLYWSFEQCTLHTIPAEDFSKYLEKIFGHQPFKLSIYDGNGQSVLSFSENPKPHTLTERLPGTQTPIDGMYHELGASPDKPLMLQWKLSKVMQPHTFPDISDWTFVIELPFAKYVDRLQQTYISAFAVMLSVTFGAFLVVSLIRNRLTRDLTSLMSTTLHLPERIQAGADISLPRSQISEVDEIANNIKSVADALSNMVEEMRIQHENLMDEVRGREKAESASKTKSEFLSMVSHELRTPLTSILGSLGLLENATKGSLEASDAQLLSIAKQNTTRLNTLVDDLLDLEKIQSGKLDIVQELIDVPSLVDNAVSSNLGYAHKLGVELRIVGDKPPVQVIGDKGRLLQVLANLLSNAAKFSPVGDVVSVSWAISTKGRAGIGSVIISVSDNGPGIPEDFQDKLFLPFEQADSSATRNIGGTGLGLSICKIISERHSGEITYDTEQGKGTTFHLTLPIVPKFELV